MSHPMQEIVKDENGIPRFKENKIVTHLLDKGPFDMNYLAMQGFSNEDLEQFAQLIGYSVCSFCSLSYASDKSISDIENIEKGS